MGIKPDWPLPPVVQEFIRLRNPEVYRLQAGGTLYGLVAHRYPPTPLPTTPPPLPKRECPRLSWNVRRFQFLPLRPPINNLTNRSPPLTNVQ